MSGFWIDNFWEGNNSGGPFIVPTVTVEQNIDTPELTADVVFEITADLES